MSKKKYTPTIRDLLLRKQVSKNVKKRSEALDKQTSIIMEERKKRKAKNKYLGASARSEKEKGALRTALRIGGRPSPSGKKFPRIGSNKKMY
jgi:transglutaminase/protease-like cytokinesis protein 3